MKRYAWNAMQLTAVFMAFAFLFGCAARAPNSIEYSLSSVADAELNRDVAGRPLSVVLAIYQLRDAGQFSRLTFEQYVAGGGGTELYGDSAISRDEVVVLPASRETIQLSLSPDASYVGIVALYRAPAAQHWRYLIPAQQLREQGWLISRQRQVDIRLHVCHFDISGVVVESIPGQRLGAEPDCGSQLGSVDHRAIDLME